MKTALIVIGALIVAVMIVAFVFEAILIKRGGMPPTMDKDMSSPLLEPTCKELLAFVATRYKKFNALPTEDVTVKSFDGLTLHARLYRGTEPVTVICCHGYRSEPVSDFANISEMYLERGYSLLFPDMRGHGKSEGKYVGFGVLDAHDVKKWVEKVEELLPGDDIFLHGVSMGAASVMNSADMFQFGEVSGIIADCGFSTPHEVFCNLIGTVYHLPRFPFIGAFELANMIAAKYDFHTYDVRTSLATGSVPAIYICGDQDRFIPPEMAASIAACCADSLIVPGAGHAASYMMATEEYRKLVYGFIDRQLGNR